MDEKENKCGEKNRVVNRVGNIEHACVILQ